MSELKDYCRKKASRVNFSRFETQNGGLKKTCKNIIFITKDERKARKFSSGPGFPFGGSDLLSFRVSHKACVAWLPMIAVIS